jgi:hypothetical protein
MKHVPRKAASCACVLVLAAAASGCPTHGKKVRSAEGRCALILSTEEYEAGSIGGEASWKGVELGKAKVSADQAEVFTVQLDQLQQDFNNMSHDMCMDWAHGAMTDAQYMSAKACLRSTNKKLRILTLGLESGTVDGAAFQAQLTMLIDEMDECEPVSVPAGQVVAAGAPGGCASDKDCAPPSFCILGGCRPIGQSGDQCAYDWDCAQPLVCPSGTCAQPAAKSTVVGSACSSDAGCEPPLYCILGGCRYLGNVGDGCEFDFDCVAPLACSSGRCSGTGGAAAAYGTPCQSDASCTPPLFCIKATCRPLGNPGDGCDIDGDCYSPYVCTAGACAVSGQVASAGAGSSGPSCTSDGDCVKPNYCIVGACRPLQPTGGICALSQDCVVGHTCVGGKCAKSVTGTPCTHDNDCNPPDYCIVGACRPLSGAGGVCSIDADCQSGLACQGGSCAQ